MKDNKTDRTLNPNFNPKEIEDDVRKLWEDIDVRHIVSEKITNNSPVGYVEGPPTMNGEPHIGHMRGRILKDLWYRFSILKGMNLVFRAGWDTQGLPVELQAEKELGLTGSKAENLKVVGEEKIVESCKKLIKKFNLKWREADALLGMSMDYDKAYWTYRDEYIEREWKYLEKAWKNGLLGEGFRVVPYCPSCQCSLSHAEVSQGYEKVSDPSLYYKVKIEGDDRYLVLWTTMPFTVVTDEMVGVKPDEEYVVVSVSSEKWIVATIRLEEIMNELGVNDYMVQDRIKGSDLAGLRYEYPLAKQVPMQVENHKNEKVHSVVAEDFVDVTTGSGMVHLSPANGEEDFEVAKRRGIPVFNPINDQARFNAEAGDFEGLPVRDADEKVVEILRKERSLVKIGKITHEYPTCWRSHHKLIWMARREYFYWVEKLGDKAIEAAKKVNYFFVPPMNRFIEMIKEKVPWCVSRDRVWGTPLPIWACSKCNEKIGLFSRKEIIENAIVIPDGPDFELHRPWIDRVKVKCHKCGNTANREPYVLDTWHNSGAAPYAAFTNNEYKELVPVKFLTEGIDQTRGWAYTLLIEHVIFTEKSEAPYKAFLFQGHILDGKGNKMSKSLGNMVEGIESLKSNPVDIMRFYMVWKASPIDSLNFSFKEMNTRSYQVLSTLYHLHLYLLQNSKYDKFNINLHSINWASDKSLLKDQEDWLLSKLQQIIESVTQDNENCRFQSSVRAIERFLIDDLSQTYVPMTRKEIWDDSPKTLNRRLAIYAILAYILKILDILLHPISPYITEHLYQKSFLEKKSILMEKWPIVEERFLLPELEEEVQQVLHLISLMNSARMKAKLKRRWPLKSAQVVLKDKEKMEKYLGLIKDQGNIKDVLFTTELKGTPIGVKITPRYDLLGSKLKTKMQSFVKYLATADSLKIYSELKDKGGISVELEGDEIKILKDELILEYTSINNDHVVAVKEGMIIALQKERDADLISDGNVRDLARRLQALRKERGYNPTEILDTAYVSGLDSIWKASIDTKLDELTFLVRVKKIKIMDQPIRGVNWMTTDIDGNSIKISVE